MRTRRSRCLVAPLAASSVMLFVFIEAGAGPFTSRAHMFSASSEIRSELKRRRQDMERIDQKIHQVKGAIGECTASLQKAEKRKEKTRGKLRKLIIMQDRMIKEHGFYLMLASRRFHEALTAARTCGRLTEAAIEEYAEADKTCASLKNELEEHRSELSDLEEIRGLLDKRKKELENLLKTFRRSNRYI